MQCRRLAVYKLLSLRPRMRRQLLLRQRLLKAQAQAELLSDVGLVRLLLPRELSLPPIPTHPPQIHPLAPPSPHPSHIHPLAPPSPHPSHIHPLALPSLHPSHIHPLAPPPSLHPLHIHVLGLTSVHPPHGHFLSCHPFLPSTWVLI
ncbi:hypothetical protein ACB092_04G162300 [Castanea dentata]